MELAGISEYPNGIYLFYNSKDKAKQDELLYVGRVKSRSFIGRLPSHFDPRQDAWFNSLTRKVGEHERLAYKDAIQVALSFKVLLIGVRDTSLITRIESVFRSFLAPRYNLTRKRYSGREYLKELLCSQG
jgi:hypothetical protein